MLDLQSDYFETSDYQFGFKDLTRILAVATLFYGLDQLLITTFPMGLLSISGVVEPERAGMPFP